MKNKSRFTHLDIFSGIGCFAYAAQQVWGDDYENLLFCDCDSFCQEVLRKNFGKEILIYDNIKQLTKEQFIADTHNRRPTEQEQQTTGDKQCDRGVVTDTIRTNGGGEDSKRAGNKGGGDSEIGGESLQPKDGEACADDIESSHATSSNTRSEESRGVSGGKWETIPEVGGSNSRVLTTTNTKGRESGEQTKPKRGEDIGRRDFKVDLLTGGFPCFAKGTSILTYSGYKSIESITRGEKVLTHTGRWRKVTATMCRNSAELFLVKGQGILPTYATIEHPYYVNGGEWVPLGEIKGGDKICQVFPTEKSEDSNTNAFWWLVGRYLADGWRVQRLWNKKKNGKKYKRKNNGRVVICCGRHRTDELAKRIGEAGFNYSKSVERTADKYHITRTGFYRFLEPFGRYAYGKTIPGFVFGLGKDKIKSLLDGYFSGDGYTRKNPHGMGNYQQVTTVSRELALGVALLAQAYGVVAGIRSYVPKGTKVIEGRTVNQREMYFVTIPERNKIAHIDGIYGWKHFRGIQPASIGTVYNLAVEEDESYVANGAVVHNCQPFSHAGKRKGTDDDRHLWPEMLRVIKEFKPTWIIGENVAGLLSMAQLEGLPYLDNETNPPLAEGNLQVGNLQVRDGQGVAEAILEDLEACGYEVQAFVIPACAVGAPHRRDRVWIVARKHTESDGAVAHPHDRGQPRKLRETLSGWENSTEPSTKSCGGSGGGDCLCGQSETEGAVTNDTEGKRWGNGNPKDIGTDTGDVNPFGVSDSISPNTAGNRRTGQGEKITAEEGLQPRSEHAGELERGFERPHRDAPNLPSEGLQGHLSESGEVRSDVRQEGQPRCGFSDWERNWHEVAIATCNVSLDDGATRGMVRLPSGKKIKYGTWRKEALKAVGNAIVPQCAMEIMRAIKAVEESNGT